MRKLQPPIRGPTSQPSRARSLNAKYDRQLGKPDSNRTASFINRKILDPEAKRRKRVEGNERFKAVGLPKIESPVPFEEGLEDCNGSRRHALACLMGNPSQMTASSSSLPPELHAALFRDRNAPHPTPHLQQQGIAQQAFQYPNGIDPYAPPQYLRYPYLPYAGLMPQQPFSQLWIPPIDNVPTQTMSTPHQPRESYGTAIWIPSHPPPTPRQVPNTSGFPVRGILRKNSAPAILSKANPTPQSIPAENRVRFSSPREFHFSPVPSFDSDSLRTCTTYATAPGWPPPSSTVSDTAHPVQMPSPYGLVTSQGCSSPSPVTRYPSIPPAITEAHQGILATTKAQKRKRVTRKSEPHGKAIVRVLEAAANADEDGYEEDDDLTPDFVTRSPVPVIKTEVWKRRGTPPSTDTRAVLQASQDEFGSAASETSWTSSQQVAYLVRSDKRLSQLSPDPSSTPTLSTPSPIQRQVRVTDGAWKTYQFPKRKNANTDSQAVKKLNKNNHSERRARYESPPPVVMYDDPAESISEFSDDSLPRLFGSGSRLSTLEEEVEGEVKARGKEVQSHVPDGFLEETREETPFFGNEGGGDRGFEVWRDGY